MKTLLAFAFSQVGVILLCIFYAVIGANMFISMEVSVVLYGVTSFTSM